MSSFTSDVHIKLLKERDKAGRLKVELLKPFIYYSDMLPNDVLVPWGYVCNLASTPRWLWWYVPPLDLYAQAAILHDYLLDTKIVDRATADKIFYEAMLVLKVKKHKAWMMYAGGNFAYRKTQTIGEDPMKIELLQKKLNVAGFGPLKVDGDLGPKTKRAIKRFQEENFIEPTGELNPATAQALRSIRVVENFHHRPGARYKNPASIKLPKAKMKRVHFHWTAGGPKASAVDKMHYHFIVEQDGTIVLGDHPVTANEKIARGAPYAAHTRGANTGAIGIGLSGMAGATESPFNAGKYPITQKQFDAACQLAAVLCEFYSIEVGPKTTLTHAEVQKNLGIRQRSKWDYTRLPWSNIRGAAEIGKLVRAQIERA